MSFSAHPASQVHENEAAGCKSALAGASAIRQEELKAYEKATRRV